jgi:Phytanoyl-CoA dioxygenase (PhyH)
MDDHERYLFDLQGFITVADALTPTQVQDLNREFDARVVANVAPDANTHRFNTLLDWGRPFRDLIDNERVTDQLAAILGPHFRLDHEYGDLIRRGKGPIGTRLHGGSVPFDPAQYYVVAQDRIRSGLVVVAYNLRDVGPMDGGFAAVPGSYKANFAFPEEWKELDTPDPRPWLRRVTGPAGTAIIFTEALSHGTLPWTGAGERRTLFYKYSPHASSWSAEFYDAARWPELTDRQRAILESPNARYSSRPTKPKT